MKKILVVLFVSMVLVSCGNNKNDNTDIVITPEPSSTTTTTIDVPTLIPTTTTTAENDSPAITAPGQKTPTPTPSGSGSIGRISIPAIGVDWPIYEGVDLSVLNNGPGHYSHSPKPCRAGNAAIAGHRTTHGAPFNKLDLLKSGDVINITTSAGDCTYKYLRTEIVSPNNVSVVMPKAGGNLLTLTACHPKGSAAQRIVVTATLENVVVH